MNKWLKAALVAIISVLGGIFYRMGGSGNFPRLFRPLGQAICFLLTMVILGLVPWAWKPILGVFLGFGMTWLETTYFKKPGTDAKWYNWLLVGAVFAVIPLPYCLLTGSHWLGFGIRAVVCMGMTVLWQEVLSAKVAKALGLGKDITDEFGRGFINIASLPLLLI